MALILVATLGLALTIAGVALLSVPAALIVAGVELVAVTYLIAENRS